MKSSPLELYWVYPLVLWRVAHVYYNRVPLVINFGYTQDSRRDALWPSPTKTSSGAIFYEPRGTRGDVVSLSLLPRSGIRRGRPVKADRYALRVPEASLLL